MGKKVCIYAICKNESKFIYRWFNSIKDADYICVLDTGSTDNTTTLLEEIRNKYPDKVFWSQKEIKPWRFDVARNESMKLIPEDTDICVSADLDDIFPKDWKDFIIEDIEKGYTKILGVYQYYENDTPAGVIPLDRTSVYGQAHWEGALHERLVCENENKIVDERFLVEHRQDLTKERRKIYLEAAKTGADTGDSYGKLCYAYELYNSNKLDECIKTFSELYDELPRNSEYLTRKWIKLVADIYKARNDTDKHIEWLRKALSIDNRNSPFEDYYLYDGVIEQELKNINLKVCVYAICKNEIKNVDNWLKPFASADYICVLDTGSTDGTWRRLLESTEYYPNLHVKRKEYKKFFFDEARNDSLELVRDTVDLKDNNILLCLDLDEYASDNIVDELKKQWTSKTIAANVYCQNVNMWATKAYLLTDDLRWRYKIHEEIVHKEGDKLSLKNTYYNHYQDTENKVRDYYGKLVEAHKEDLTCIHYLTYLIWEASLHEDLKALKEYCEEDLEQILNNKEDQHYHDWKHYIYVCSMYMNYGWANENHLKSWLNELDKQEENFRAYYTFKANLYNSLNDAANEVKNLKKALFTPITDSWVEANFNQNDNELYTRLVLKNYYDIKNYELAYLYAKQAYNESNNSLNENNLKVCEEKFKEILNGK